MQKVYCEEENQNGNSIAVIAPETHYGRAVLSAHQAIANRVNLFATEDVTIFSPHSSNLAPDIRNFTRYDERILQAKLEKDALLPEEEKGEIKDEEIDLLQYPPPFDAVLMPVGGDLARSVSNLLSHYDLPPHTVKRLGTGLLDDPALATEQSLNGAWFAAPSPQLRTSFEQRYKSIYNKAPPRLSTLAYDATALAAVLAQRGLKSQGRPAFTHSDITNPNGFSGIDGIFRFRPNGTAERGLAILELHEGDIRIIDDAPRTFQAPMPF